VADKILKLRYGVLKSVIDLYNKYREDFCSFDRFHSSAFHGDRCAAHCEAHINFADESDYLTADNVQNEGKFSPLFTDHRKR
jgi:hypothetical protein